MLAMFFDKIGLKESIGTIFTMTEISPNAMKAEEKILGFMTLLMTRASRFLGVF